MRTLNILVFFLFCGFLSLAYAEDGGLDERLVVGDDATITRAARLPVPVSRAPENTTIIYESDIRALNAHTLVEILNTVPGVALANWTGPASTTFTFLQGADYNHVLILLDGLPLNSLAENFADVALIPAQIIERVEIVKGAASTAWGQALGGVINVVTKSPKDEVSGTLSLSQGDGATRQAWGELSGVRRAAGCYLAVNNFASDGIVPHLDWRINNVHAKLMYQLPLGGDITFIADEANIHRSELYYAARDLKTGDETNRVAFNLLFNKPLNQHLKVGVSAHSIVYAMDLRGRSISTERSLQFSETRETTVGGRTELTWREKGNAAIMGFDIDGLSLSQTDALHHVDLSDREVTRWGLYANGNWAPFAGLSLSPGLRYDHTGTSGNHTSASFGATYQVGEKTTLRGYTATGYSLPSFALNKEAPRVWTTQLGVETEAVPSLWVKGTFFRNDTKDVLEQLAGGVLRETRQVRRGVELEARTIPFLKSSVFLGYTFTDAFYLGAPGGAVFDVPRHIVIAGIDYDDGRWARVKLIGKYVDFNAMAYHHGSYGAMVWDFFVTATPFPWDKGLELFFSAYNLSDAHQYIGDVYPNPGRWMEGGMRWRF